MMSLTLASLLQPDDIITIQAFSETPSQTFHGRTKHCNWRMVEKDLRRVGGGYTALYDAAIAAVDTLEEKAHGMGRT